MDKTSMICEVCFVTSVSFSCTDICIQGKVRLVGGSGKYEGNVQVCINGTWGYVCDNKWGINNAKVVCSQLGYSKSSMYILVLLKHN